MIAWKVLCAALLPLNIQTFPALLGGYLGHLERTPDRTRPRRAAVFRDALH